MTALQKRKLNDRDAMRGFAREISTHLGLLSQKRVLILLSGSMGAGKTQFTRDFLEALGSKETASPSFAIHHRYATSLGPVDHFDLFRIESEEDLESTGFWDFFLASSGIVILEWADRLEDLGLTQQLPHQWQKIKIKILPFIIASEERDIELEGL